MEFDNGSNIYIRPMEFPFAGYVVDGHAHNFDHTTYVVKGSVRIEALDGAGNPTRSVIKRAGEVNCFVLIRAGVLHRLTALEDNCLAHCIYAHRTPQGDVVQRNDGWTISYD